MAFPDDFIKITCYSRVYKFKSIYLRDFRNKFDALHIHNGRYCQTDHFGVNNPVILVMFDKEIKNIPKTSNNFISSFRVVQCDLGKGNSNFATPTNQTPRFAELGKPGEERNIELELKLIADVGLVGFPNAGKSTLISVISDAKPKIADYPFTTLEPNLGIVRYKNYKSITVADIPGIIEGAHLGKGLGLKFLRHIERTKILLIMIDVTSEDYGNDYKTLINELEKYSKILSKKKKIVAFSKADLLQKGELKKVAKRKIPHYKGRILVFSAATNYGIQELLDTFWQTLESEK